ncbi:MAG: sulfotransferase [Candidatus Binatus sp.]|uniref:sulfotransferase domain-containing protein n=1 Tax=Candidatus Binatus sp. TaxID=2811406 RepID=UPI0027238464|nr:sulfotransferase domain-containing protein [Candidatus Binatus sp.]MDO8432761.1 sulfotransferase [Candidatus Binatus sp.]
MKRHKNRRFPDFLAVGPPRTATTWLHRALIGRVGLPAHVKETNFFDVCYDRGIDWYLDHFRDCPPDLPMGEISCYFGSAPARQRIQHHIPECKIIITLRDPVQRAYSAYKLMRCRAYTRAGFEDFLEQRPHVIRGSKYAFHLSDWIARFGRDRVFVSFYEELKDEQAYFDRVCAFIGIESHPLSEVKGLRNSRNSFACAPRSHKLAQNARHFRIGLKRRGFYRTMNLLERIGVWDYCFGRGDPFAGLSLEQDARVRRRFIREVEAVEDLLQMDLSDWKDSPRDRDQSAAGSPDASTDRIQSLELLSRS